MPCPACGAVPAEDEAGGGSGRELDAPSFGTSSGQYHPGMGSKPEDDIVCVIENWLKSKRIQNVNIELAGA